MRKLKKPIERGLPPLKLYLDDLESICDILKRETKEIDIRANTGSEEYEVEDIKQLKGLGIKKIHGLSIKCSDPYITIVFYPSWAEIHFDEDSTYNRGILSEIEEITNKHKVFLGHFWNSSWSAILIGVLIGGSFGGVLAIPKNYSWIFLALELIFILSLALLWRFQLRGYSTIVLLERKEEVSFWRRNKDQIIVAIIAAVAGSFITAFVFWLAKLF